MRAMNLSLPVVLFTVAFVLFVIEALNTKALLAFGLALCALAFAVQSGLHL